MRRGCSPSFSLSFNLSSSFSRFVRQLPRKKLVLSAARHNSRHTSCHAAKIPRPQKQVKQKEERKGDRKWGEKERKREKETPTYSAILPIFREPREQALQNRDEKNGQSESSQGVNYISVCWHVAHPQFRCLKMWLQNSYESRKDEGKKRKRITLVSETINGSYSKRKSEDRHTIVDLKSQVRARE